MLALWETLGVQEPDAELVPLGEDGCEGDAVGGWVLDMLGVYEALGEGLIEAVLLGLWICDGDSVRVDVALAPGVMNCEGDLS